MNPVVDFKDYKNEDSLTEAIKVERELSGQLLKKFKKEMENMPAGGISRKNIKGNYYFYHNCRDSLGNNHQKYLGKNEMELAEKLRRKAFLKKCMPILFSNIKMMEKFLLKYRPFFASDIIKGLVVPFESQKYYAPSLKAKIKAWINEPYERLEMKTDSLIHTSVGGIKMRSKSETIIADILEQNGIPYRYEAKLILGGKTYYPDFTIIKPRDGEILYWEHFGMMNDQNYAKRAENKLDVFSSFGLIPWQNCINTYDDINGSFNSSIVFNVIRAFIN
ncbi:MAG: hypothetical protein WCQ41_00345 [Bacillota bacterium]